MSPYLLENEDLVPELLLIHKEEQAFDPNSPHYCYSGSSQSSDSFTPGGGGVQDGRDKAGQCESKLQWQHYLQPQRFQTRSSTLKK